MQERQRAEDYYNEYLQCEEDLQALSFHEHYTLIKAREFLQGLNVPPPEAIEQMVSTLPAKYRQMAMQAVVEQFVLSMKWHILQLAALFYRQAEAEGISAEDRDETLQDVEADLREIMTLDQRLKIDSVRDLFKLGAITTGIIKLSHSKRAEETEGSLYSLPDLYQGWLEDAHLFREEQPE